LVGFEDQAQSKEQKTARERALKEGKLAPEIFDKSFVETPKAFYAGLEKHFDAAVAASPHSAKPASRNSARLGRVSGDSVKG